MCGVAVGNDSAAAAGAGKRPRPALSVAVAVRCARSCCARLCSNVGLCALVAAYALLGAALFEALEADFEAQQRGRAQRHRRKCLRELWDITVRMNVLYERNWTRLASTRLRGFEREVAAAARLRGYDGGAGRQWTFSGALLYSVTVITTIGYGNLAPRTPEGKLLTMLYALVGVPLVLLCVSNLGALLAGAFQFAYAQWTRAATGSDARRPPSPPTTPASSLPPSPIHSPPSTPSPPPPPPPLHPPSPAPPPRPRSPSPPLPEDAAALLAECEEYSAMNGGVEERVLAAGAKSNGDGGGEGECEGGDDCRDSETLVPFPRREKRSPSRVLLLPPSTSGRSASIVSFAAAVATAPPTAHPPPAPVPARVPAAAVLLVLVGYICAGAAAFAAWEEWSFLDGAYFCFITLSTIGFGDLVPGKSFERARSEGGHAQLVACCAYLLLGLVLLAMAFSLLQEEAVARLRRLGARLRPPSQR